MGFATLSTKKNPNVAKTKAVDLFVNCKLYEKQIK